LWGQHQAVELLTQAVKQERVAPAYLFVGPSGGTELSGSVLVEQLFCASVPTHKQQQVQNRLQLGNHPDVLWWNPPCPPRAKRLSAAEAANTGLKRKAPPVIRTEQIWEIAQFLSRPP